MNIYKYIQKHIKVVNVLYNAGFIPFEVKYHMDIYKYYSDCINLNVKKKSAILLTMDYFKISQRTVYNVLKQFEQ